jgi:hypothetical protein
MWYAFLHNHVLFWLKYGLNQEKRDKKSTVIVIDVPYHVKG